MGVFLVKEELRIEGKYIGAMAATKTGLAGSLLVPQLLRHGAFSRVIGSEDERSGHLARVPVQEPIAPALRLHAFLLHREP
jgi:hypothetical protein